MKIEIKPVSDSDIKEIAELEKICFESDVWSEDMFKAMLESPAGYVFGAYDEGKLCAYACVYVIAGDRDRADGDADISNIAVSPEYRRRGIGKILIEKACALAKENYCEKIYLEVRRSNSAAVSLYTEEGFEVYGERKNYYSAPREDAVLMLKRL